MLNYITDSKGARKKSKRLGRGIGSGKGKTCGRGGKGQKGRSGVAIGNFEGGQMPLYRRLPKRGFNNVNSKKYHVINFSSIEKLIANNLLDSSDITLTRLKDLGVIKGKNVLLKILGKGDLNTKVSLQGHSVSKSAKEKLSASGGNIVIIERKFLSNL